MKNMKSHLMLGAWVAFSLTALNAAGAPMGEDSRVIPLPTKGSAANSQALPAKALPTKTSSESTVRVQTPAQALPKTLPKKSAQLPAKKAKKAASLPAKKPSQKVKITFDSSPSGDSSIVIVERDFGLSTNPSTNVKRKLLARPDFNYSSNNVMDLPYEEDGQPLLQRIYDDETGPPPSNVVAAPEVVTAPHASAPPAIVTAPTLVPASPNAAETQTPIESKPVAESNSVPSNSLAQTNSTDAGSSKVDIGDQRKDISEILASSESSKIPLSKLRTVQRPSRFEMLTPPATPTPEPMAQTLDQQAVASTNKEKFEDNDAPVTQSISTTIKTAPSATQSRFSIGTGYLDTKYDRLAPELKNGATTLNLALGRTFGLWDTSILVDIAHGMDQSVTIANTRSLMLRAQGLRMFNATSTIKPLLGASAGLGDINVRSYRDDGSGKVSLREHASGMAFSVSGVAGIRALMNYESNSISADLLVDATAMSGAGEISKLGGVGARLMIGFGL